MINLNYIQRVYVQENEYKKYEIRGILDTKWEHPHEVLALCENKEEAIEKMNRITKYLKKNDKLIF